MECNQISPNLFTDFIINQQKCRLTFSSKLKCVFHGDSKRLDRSFKANFVFLAKFRKKQHVEECSLPY